MHRLALSTRQSHSKQQREEVLMAHLKEIVIDAWRPVALARFWEEVLDDFSIAPYPEFRS